MVTVKYDDLSAAFGFVSFAAPFEHRAFVSLDTGAVYWVSDANPIDEENLPDDLETSDRYIPIPHKNELDLGNSLAFRFADEHLPHRYANVEACFRRRGAYARFKELLATEGCLEKWYAFEAESTERALRDWCKANQIHLVDDGSQQSVQESVAMDHRFVSKSFPRSSEYHPEWIIASASGGANSLWLAEWLTEALDLQPGMRVLDLGCGRGASSIFLRREFGVQVWAADLWNSVTERLQRVRDAGVEDGVFPIHADARSLPFAAEFFDAIVCIDAFPYCGGTDDLYLNYLARFVRPGGLVGIAGAGVAQDIEGAVPEHLRAWWIQDQGWCLHSATWWRKHWEQSGIMDIEVADTMPDGWQKWLDWHRAIAPDNREEIEVLEADRGGYLGYVRLVGRRRTDAHLQDPIVSVPAAVDYKKVPLLRDPSTNR